MLKLALILKVSKSLQGAYALHVCHRSLTFGQNVHPVVLNRKKFQIYATMIIVVTIGTWLTQNYPYPKVAFSKLRTFGHIMPIVSPSGLVWVITFSHTLALRSVRCTYIFVHRCTMHLFSWLLFWSWSDSGASMATFYLWHTYSINTKWLPHSNAFHYYFWS